jgi:hypothetical protein
MYFANVVMYDLIKLSDPVRIRIHLRTKVHIGTLVYQWQEELFSWPAMFSKIENEDI